MTLFGLHWIDSLILIAYVLAVLVIGKVHSGNVKGENDFFLGGRSLGKWFQFFLSFGNMTDPGQATTTASSVYRQGAGGAWLALITLFLTPYYWFTNVWFRRVRLTTMADLFQDRFGRRFLATLYAVSTILMAVVGIAGGNVVALKTLQPMMVKPPSAYTAADREEVGNFQEFSVLRKERLAASLSPEKAARYEVLKGFYDRGELQPYVSYLSPVPFYLASSVLVAVFVMLGGLVGKNLYEPLFPGQSERQYMVIARLTVPVMLALGMGIGLYLNSVVALLKFAIVLLVVWGVPITLIFLWRRLTETAVRVQVVATLLFVAVIPWIVPAIPALARSAALTAMTRERTVTHTRRATADDVAAGQAAAVGEPVTRVQVIEPVSVYFEEGVVHTNPHDLSSPRTGVGLFRVEVYVLSLLGVDITAFTPAGLMTTRYLVDAVLPVLILIVVSLLTSPTDPVRVARFYVRLKTPVSATLEEDAVAVQQSYANPARYDDRKLFPKSNWEFTKWDRVDTLGFLGCCALVGGILLFFKAVLAFGA